MHELWLCRSIFEILDQKTKDKPYTRIKKVYIEIGELAAIEKSALLFSFNLIAKSTIAKDAVLEILTLPGMANCNDCHKTVRISQYSDPCHYCGSFSLILTQGDELRVKSMEVE